MNLPCLALGPGTGRPPWWKCRASVAQRVTVLPVEAGYMQMVVQMSQTGQLPHEDSDCCVCRPGWHDGMGCASYFDGRSLHKLPQRKHSPCRPGMTPGQWSPTAHRDIYPLLCFVCHLITHIARPQPGPVVIMVRMEKDIEKKDDW